MGTTTQTARAEITLATNPKTYNITSPAIPNTEFSQALTNGTKSLIIRTKDSGVLDIAWVSGGNSLTIKKNAVYNKENINLTGATVYMKVDTASEIVQIEEWT